MRKTLILPLLWATASAAAQTGANPPEVDGLRTCVAMAERKQADSAAAVGKTIEPLYRKRIAKNRRDVEAMIGLARVQSQCLLPAANFISQGSLSQDAMALLEDALDIDPTHWIGRYTLASIAYRSPAFLGRGDIAAKNYDELIRQQGSRSRDPMFARPYEFRGQMLMKDGKADSARALWARGLTLFPDDSALNALVARHRNPSPEPAPLQMQAMTITARAEAAPSEAPIPAIREVSRAEILSTAGGAADVFNAVQAQPGATRAGEGSSIYTRGGDASETVTILNGSRVLSLNRFEGLNGGMFGALEPWVVRSVKYSPGGFSAQHGNALSGVVEIETEGKPRERKTRIGLSLVQASGTQWLPAGRKAGGWISARVSQTAALLATHGRTNEFDGAPHSEEMIASMVVTPTPEVELRGIVLLENDGARRVLNAAGWNGPFVSHGSTQSVMLSSRWNVSESVTLTTSGAAAARASDFEFGVLSRDRHDRSGNLRTDLTFERDAIVIRSGVAGALYERDDRGTVPVSPSVAPGAPSRSLADVTAAANERGGYGEVELKRGSSTAIIGARADLLPSESKISYDPRVTLMHRRGAWTGRVSGGVFHQGRWRADAAIPDGGTPSGLAGRAEHLIGSLENNSGPRTLRAEIYTKRYADYRAFGSGPTIAGTRVKGLDLLADHRGGGALAGWLAYSLLEGRTTLADGRRVRAPLDITHTLSASGTATKGDWSLGATARYGTGVPTTPIIGTVNNADGFPRPVYGSPMSQRLPSYGRLDMRVMRHARTARALVSSFAEIINLTSESNVAGVTYDASYRNAAFTPTFFSKRTIVVGAEVQFR